MNLSDHFYASGYVMSKMLCDFVKMANERARFPVKVLLRDGIIFADVREQLGNLGALDTSKPWECVNVSREVMENYAKPLRSENLARYFSQHGLDKNCTLVDTGIHGTISKALKHETRKKVQTLFLAKIGNPRNCYGYLNGKIRSDTDIAVALENLPHKYESFFGREFICDNGKISPLLHENKLSKNQIATRAGFDNGLKQGTQDYAKGRIFDTKIDKKYYEILSTCDMDMVRLLQYCYVNGVHEKSTPHESKSRNSINRYPSFVELFLESQFVWHGCSRYRWANVAFQKPLVHQTLFFQAPNLCTRGIPPFVFRGPLAL